MHLWRESSDTLFELDLVIEILYFEGYFKIPIIWVFTIRFTTFKQVFSNTQYHEDKQRNNLALRIYLLGTYLLYGFSLNADSTTFV